MTLSAPTVLDRVTQLHQAGDFIAAEALLIEALTATPDNAELLHGLGVTKLILGDPQAAVGALQAAITQAPEEALYYYNLGLGLEATGDVFAACEAYRQSLMLDPEHVNAYLNWGNLFLRVGYEGEAEKIYREALKFDPENFGGNWNLGNILMEQQDLTGAIAAYTIAAKSDTSNADFQANYELATKLAAQTPDVAAKYFADVLQAKGAYPDAIAQYQSARDLGENSPAIQQALVKCYKETREYDSAVGICEDLIDNHPQDRHNYFLALTVFQQAGMYESAQAVYQQAMSHFPGDLQFQLENCRTLPVIYQTAVDIATYRQRFTESFTAFSQQLDLSNPQTVTAVLEHLNHTTNFLLAYQGENDIELQRQYCRLVSQVLAIDHHQWQVDLPIPEIPSGKIRIGILSDVMGKSQLGHFFLGWVQNLDPAIFEVYIYHLNQLISPLTRDFWARSQEFRHIHKWPVAKIAQQVIADQLHILVLPEIGMKPEMTLLSNLRLAPIQCTTWTHPVTSGSAMIDYFLSSELMEPEDGQSHYSETLVGLPGIGIHHPRPAVPDRTATRSEFGLDDDRVVYLCCQSLFKYLPQDDWVWPAIAQALPKAQFAFIQHPSSHTTQLFQQRLKTAFDQFDLDSEAFCVFTPRLSEPEYMQLNLLSDVFLDSHRWSGGMTTMKAIVCDLPIVTCPSGLMRGRHSYGILRMMEIEATIAQTLDEYVEIAVRLGHDHNWRNEVIDQMRPQQAKLFNDMSCVDALQDFFQAAVFEQMMAAEA
ncbi:tetratricopeptide repeat protein [filamentous cyanobacterium LEGE 11480]|uniref:protein O-GlcNAc transferase n=1 Tax=Romeriopsis navalis LEGE 11480 TaxID=2777977 RepID=A0A928Z4X0_9CYAN|nr:glycosyltransferase family 41 protein [Romeriopsis navalis]MBE9031457.1 tetratricopeptide repeat protein [Romeriopsis navalis LEGE 11480]